MPLQRLAPGESVYMKYKPNKANRFYDTIPSIVSPKYTSWGITDANTQLKVIASTVEFKSSPYTMSGLELDKPNERDIFDDFDDDLSSGSLADWATKDIHINTVRPLDSADLADSDVTLQGLTVKGHTGLKAKINLSSQKEATRAVGDTSKSAPSALTGSKNFDSLSLNDAVGHSAPLSILELTDVADTSIINEEAPLELEIGGALGDDETVLPVGYDEASGMFIPLGSATKDAEGKTQISIDQLPSPTEAGTRSLGGSIKIFFKKVILSKVGFDYEYPVLAEGIVSEDGETLTYNKDKEDIKQKVAKANKVVVFVHGIIGDTLDMTKSVRKGFIEDNGEKKYLGDLYDLVLTFDYEKPEYTHSGHRQAIQATP